MTISIKNLISALLISISVYFGWTNILPAYERTSELKPVIEERIALLSSRREILDKVKEFNSGYEEKYTEFQRLSNVVPAKESMPELLSTFEAVFTQTGNVLGELTLGISEKEETPKIIGFEVDVEGDYANLIELLQYLESNIRLMDIFSLTVGQDQQVEGRLTANIKGQVYFIDPATLRESSVEIPGTPIAE